MSELIIEFVATALGIMVVIAIGFLIIASIMRGIIFMLKPFGLPSFLGKKKEVKKKESVTNTLDDSAFFALDESDRIEAIANYHAMERYNEIRKELLEQQERGI